MEDDERINYMSIDCIPLPLNGIVVAFVDEGCSKGTDEA